MTIDTRLLSKDVRLYARLGLHLDPDDNGKQSDGECPFCMTDHFTVKNEGGLFVCGNKRCKVSGNFLTFMRKVYEDSEVGASVQEIAQRRNLKVETLEHFGMKSSMLDNAAMMPIYNPEGKLVNLLTERMVDTKKGKKLRPIAIEGLPVHLLGLQHLTPDIKRVWIVEGPWKMAAWQELLWSIKATKAGYQPTDDKTVSVGRNIAVLGLIGVRGFNDKWADLLGDREVVIGFDNDEPKNHEGNVYSSGWEWSQRTSNKISSPKKRLLCWGKGGHDESLADGYDLGDLRKDKGDVAAYEFAQKHLTAPPHRAHAAEIDPGVEPAECTTFNRLCEVFSDAYHFPKVMRQSLAVACAVILSTEAADDHLWFRFIAPPGAGKSTIATACSAALEYVYPLSKVKGFHSGFVLPGSRRNQDHSLFPLMHGKCAIWKDADTLIQAGNRNEIMSELRDVYDSTANASYRHGIHHNYENLRITFILCGTQILRELNQTMHGERFLDFELFEEGDTMPYINRAFSNAQDEVMRSFGPRPTNEGEESPSKVLAVKQYTYGYLKYLKENKYSFIIPPMTKRFSNRLKAMAILLSFVRARPPEKGKNQEVTYKARQEVATRLSKQFVRLAYCLCFVLNKSSFDDEVEDILLKVMYNTSDGYHFDTLRALLKSDMGLTRAQLATHLGISDTGVDRILLDLRHFNTIKRNDRPNNSGTAGRHTHYWMPSEKIGSLWKIIHEPRLES